jgi:hypothetical protein
VNKIRLFFIHAKYLAIGMFLLCLCPILWMFGVSQGTTFQMGKAWERDWKASVAEIINE